MLERLVDFSLNRRGIIVIASIALIIAGVFSALNVPIDSVPDITSPQVQINTPVEALAPEEIELFVTAPIERVMAGLPDMVELRSLSKAGLSQVNMTFEDGVEILRARQLVTERLNTVAQSLPAEITPELAPISTGLGEIVYYTLRYKPDAAGKPADRMEQLRQLRQVHDILVKPQLRSTPGLAEVNSIGGYERQIVIEPDPEKLAAAGVGFSELAEVIEKSSQNTGGGILEVGSESVTVRADTRVRSLAEIEELPVKFAAGAEPLLVRDLAAVGIGSAVRVGTSTEGGEETVTGAAIMLAGANSRVVAHAAVERLEEISAGLPEGVEIHIVYDRSNLVDATIRTVRNNLAEGAILVAAVLFAFLGNWRAALIVTLVIPLSFLFMLTGMAQSRISANLMSLGAIDFGLIVDGAIVMVENIVRHIAEKQTRLGRSLTNAERLREVRVSAKEVARPMFFGVLIITVVYVPILALSGIEGKMFRPMAISVMLAIGGALALALTLMPVLCSWSLRGTINERDGWLVRLTKAIYTPLLAAALRLRVLVVVIALALFGTAGWVFSKLGAEFIPQLDEGAIAIQVIRGNSVGLGASLALQKRTERLLLERFPEISHVFARIGTAEVATDPMGQNTADTYVHLNPRDTWRRVDGRAITKAQLLEMMRDELTTTIPGQTYLFSQPIQLRFNELMAGARADLSLKIFGTDFEELERLATSARDVMRTIPGGGDVEFDAPGRVPMLEITPRRDALKRLNLHADEINTTVASALAGRHAGTFVEDNWLFDVVIRLPEERRQDLEALGNLPVRSNENTSVQVPLERLAEITVAERLGTITREDTRRRVTVLINVRGRDTESFVAEARERLRSEMTWPDGYSFEFGGQFENLSAARARLAVIVPIALALIFILIHASFGSVRQAALVFSCVPLAATGGVAALWIRGLPFTISAAVGFIALSGIAVLNGIMLISFINQLRAGGHSVRNAVVEGTLTRLRPKLMTALVASLGFVPMAIATGPGAEVQRPLATVVIGGIISATFLTLIVLPVLYDWLEGSKSQSTTANS